MSIEGKVLFKMWNVLRTKKTTVILNSADTDLYEKLILKASEKLGLDGSVLVLESDGTVVDENEALLYLHKEIFILLQKNELWMPLVIDSSEKSLSSTITNVSNDSFIDSAEQPILFLELDQPNKILPLVSNVPETNMENISIVEPLRMLNPPEMIVSEDFWRKFEIPWQKLPHNILEEINAGKRGKHIEEEVLSLVIREMRTVQIRIPLNHFRIIVHKIIEKSPKTFQDIDDDGIVLGDGSSTLLLKLKERNNYKNQLCKRRSRTADIVPKKKTKSGDIFIENKTKEEESNYTVDGENLEMNIIKLNQDFLNLNDDDLLQLLSKTYLKQREFIENTNPSIDEVQRSWPCLLHYRVMSWHYKRLLGHDLAQLETAINIKIDHMLDYLLSKKIIKKIPEDIAEKHLELLRGLAKHFKEPFDYLLKVLPSLSYLEEVGSLSPCILHVKDENKYYVVIEKVAINEGTNLFMLALKQFYASFFVFNMKYPGKVNSTMELLQRYFMKTHPDSGTKSNTFSKSKSAVIRFLKSLSDYIMMEIH